jgi:hypothetical protein
MKPIIFSIFLFVSLSGFTQVNDEVIEKKKFTLNPWDNINGFRVAPSYLKNFEFEGSYLITSYPERDPGFGGFFLLVQNIGIGLEYINIGNQNAIGAKLSYEINYSILSAQIGGDVLKSDKDVQYRIMPKLGLSTFGIITIYYGWNYNLRNESTLILPKHTITLQINVLDIFYK